MPIDNSIFTHSNIVSEFSDTRIFNDSTDKGVGTNFHAKETVINCFGGTKGKYFKYFTEGCVERADDGPSEELWVFKVVRIDTWLVCDIEEFDDASGDKEFGEVEDSCSDIKEEGDEDDLPEVGEGEVFEKYPAEN